MRTHSLPVLPKERAITLRADSIWLERTRASVTALRPCEPKATVIPRVANLGDFGLRRMVCDLRNFTFLGNNIHFYSIGLRIYLFLSFFEKMSPLYTHTLMPSTPSGRLARSL